MSAIQIPGLDIEERSPGTFRVRVRVHPFFALTNTFGNELAALGWGCQQLERLHALHKQLSNEARLPGASLSRDVAQALGLADLIAGDGESSAASSARAASPGDEIFVFEVLDSYLENEAKELSAGCVSRARRLKDYFGNVVISSITMASLKAYRHQAFTLEWDVQRRSGACRSRRWRVWSGTSSAAQELREIGPNLDYGSI